MSDNPLTSTPRSDPTLLYRYRDALYAPDLLIVGLHLDLFSALAREPATLAGICATFGIAERPADVMVTLFTAMGLLEQREGIFSVTDTARDHLVTRSPWYLGPYYPTLNDRPIARDLLEVVRTGKPANWSTHQAAKDWHAAMEGEPFAEAFTAAMDCRGLYLAQFVARVIEGGEYRHLLDIGGGSGVYACVAAAHHPHLRATVFEKPPVDGIAATAIAKRNLSDRVGVVAGDMLTDPLPTTADIHLFSNVLHDWDVPVVVRLIEKSFAALAPGGAIVIHDAFLNAGKTGPLHVAEYSVLLVHASEGRCYSVAEMEGYLSGAGFVEISYAETAARRGVMKGVRRRQT